MTTQFKPKNRIEFPNQWALDSFLLKLKSSRSWSYKATLDGRGAELDLQGSKQGILIGLNKSMSFFVTDLNGEAMGDSADKLWTEIFEYSNRYRC